MLWLQGNGSNSFKESYNQALCALLSCPASCSSARYGDRMTRQSWDCPSSAKKGCALDRRSSFTCASECVCHSSQARTPVLAVRYGSRSTKSRHELHTSPHVPTNNELIHSHLFSGVMESSFCTTKHGYFCNQMVHFIPRVFCSHVNECTLHSLL